METIKVIWTDSELYVTSAPDLLKEKLYYWHKAIEKDPNSWTRRINRERVLLYQDVTSQPGTIVMFQGFLDFVIGLLKKNNLKHEVFDQRKQFPGPQLWKVKGFRGSQLDMFVRMLTFNRSGLFQAPTRYGKTIEIINTMRVFPGLKTVLAAPGINLLGQLIEELQAAMPEREIKGIFTGSKGKKQSEDITVCSLDSLQKIDAEDTRLLLIDEPHAAVSPSRMPVLAAFKNARIYGFGATVEGRFDGADKLITGIIGPVLVSKTFKEAVAEKAICNIKVFMVRVRFTPWRCMDRDAAYTRLMYKNREFYDIVQKITTEVIPESWQTLIFVDEIKQAELLEALVIHGVTAIASNMSKDEREQKFKLMVNDKIKRMIATNIYAQGVTFPQLRVIVNSAGGGGSITSTQKPGRLAQRQPGKTAGYMIDFLFDPIDQTPQSLDMTDAFTKWECVVRDCESRMQTYAKNGYDVEIVEDLSAIRMV